MKRGILYFTLVFGVGFVLGAVRVFWLVPRVEERVAELIEAPFMLAAILLSARFVVRRLPSPKPSSHLGSGVFALAILLAVEFTVVLALRGLSMAEYLKTRDPIAGAVYVALLVLFALAPWGYAQRRSAANESLERTRP